MPKYTIDLRDEDRADGETMAILLSYIAYPRWNSPDRLKFQRVIYRYAMEYRAAKDPSWASSLQPVRVQDVLEGGKVSATDFKRGMKKFRANMLMASHFLSLNLDRGGTEHRIPRLPNGMKADVANTADFVMRLLGWRGQNQSTFKQDVWKPTKLICHLAFAVSETMSKHGHSSGSLFYKLFFNEEFAIAVMRSSETIRLKIAKDKSLRLSEASTIQFYERPNVPKPLRFAKLP